MSDLATRLRDRNERFQAGFGNYLYYSGADSVLDCDAADEILRLQKLVEEMSWRPIETAPATGRFLAAYIDPDELAAGNPDPYEGIEVLSGPHKFRSGKMSWLNHNSGNYSTFPATHWMPMPPLPSKALSNKEETK